jgi:hypothetical protein
MILCDWVTAAVIGFVRTAVLGCTCWWAQCAWCATCSNLVLLHVFQGNGVASLLHVAHSSRLWYMHVLCHALLLALLAQLVVAFAVRMSLAVA